MTETSEAANPITEIKEENKNDDNINEQKGNDSNCPDLQQNANSNEKNDDKPLDEQQKEIGDKLLNNPENKADAGPLDEQQKEIGDKLLNNPENEADAGPLAEQQKEIGDKLLNNPENKAETGPLDEQQKEIGEKLLNGNDENPDTAQPNEQEKDNDSSHIENEGDSKPTEEHEKDSEEKPPNEPEDRSQAQIFSLKDIIEANEEKKRQFDLKFKLFINPSYQQKSIKEEKKEEEDSPDSNKSIKNIYNTSSQHNKVISPTKSPNKRSPRKNKREVVRYDRSIFQNNGFFEEERTYPSSPSEKVELTVTLKDIGLEGLDSSTPDKAENIRKKENEKRKKLKEIEDEKETEYVLRPTVFVNYNPRKRLNRSMPVSIKTNNLFNNDVKKCSTPNTVEQKKPKSLLSTLPNNKKPMIIIPCSLLSESDN